MPRLLTGGVEGKGGLVDHQKIEVWAQIVTAITAVLGFIWVGWQIMDARHQLQFQSVTSYTISIVIAVAVVLLTLFLLTYAKNLTFQTGLTFIFIAVTISWFVYSLISPLSNLFDWRMIKAPDILVSLREDNVLIEMARDRHAPEGSPNIIRLVRYASTCPICSGKVEVVEGKMEFPNRFVGRCRESPAEHVYSFDRVMLKGMLLR
jgi:hypothetical protein